jgi:hypothetical protein
MSCPTCGRTIQCVNDQQRMWWCPCCGTIRQASADGGTIDDEVPTILRRVIAKALAQARGVHCPFEQAPIDITVVVHQKDHDPATIRCVHKDGKDLWP